MDGAVTLVLKIIPRWNMIVSAPVITLPLLWTQYLYGNIITNVNVKCEWNCRNSEGEFWFLHRNCNIATSDTLLAVLHICQPQQNKVVADGPNINHIRGTTEWEVCELVPVLHCTWWQWWWWCGIKAAAAAWPPLVHTTHRTHEAQQGDNTYVMTAALPTLES